MKKLFVCSVLVAVVAFVFSGCSSIPAKEAREDSLVVIKTEFINPDSLPRGRELSFVLSGDYPPSRVGEFSWDFSLAVIREPGVMVKSIGTELQGNFRGQDWNPDVNVPLPYAAGQIVIADYALVHKIEKTGPNSQSTTLYFRKITPQEKDDLMNALLGDERFASWKQ